MGHTASLKIFDYLQAYSPFLIIWIISLSIVIYLGFIFRANKQSKNPTNYQSNNSSLSPATIKGRSTYISYCAIFTFCIFIIVYIYLMLYGEDFAYHDNEQFTLFSLQNVFYKMPIWRENARLWPLGLQEYNLISLISKTPFAYHCFSVLQLLITIYLCFSILSSLKLISKIVITTVIITSSTFVISFFGLIFTERNIIFWLAVFIFCYAKKQANSSFIYVVGIFVSAQFLLYYKEVCFIFIMGFSFCHLALKSFQDRLWKKINYKTISQFIKDNWTDFGIIFLSLVFVCLYIYVFYVYGQGQGSYAYDNQSTQLLSTFIGFVKINIILLIFLSFVALRIAGILSGRYRISVIWDSLAAGNILYFIAYLKLNMFRWYYTAPVDFVAILYLANIVSNALAATNKNKYRRPLVVSLLIIVVITNINYSSYAIIARKKEIESRIRTAGFLKEYMAELKVNNDVNLYYPSNIPYYIMEMSSYLYYKKLPIIIEDDSEEEDQDKRDSPYLVMKAPEEFTDNLCVFYRPFKCFKSDRPNKNDLIVFLPETAMLFNPDLNMYMPKEKIGKYEQSCVTLFKYSPEYNGIEKVLYYFAKNRIDEQWFNVYIFTDLQNENIG